MPTKLQFAQAVLAASVVHDLVWSIKARRAARKLIEENNNLKAELAHVTHMLSYLARTIDSHGIELDEFDLIALHNPLN